MGRTARTASVSPPSNQLPPHRLFAVCPVRTQGTAALWQKLLTLRLRRCRGGGLLWMGGSGTLVAKPLALIDFDIPVVLFDVCRKSVRAVVPGHEIKKLGCRG